MADNKENLAGWWKRHNHLIRDLPAPDQAAVIEEKDRLKEALP